MTVWMICVHPGGARVFMCRSLNAGVQFHRSILGDNIEATVRDLESELPDYSGSFLIIAAEERMLEAFVSSLGAETRKKVIGTVPLDLFEANETDLIHYVDDFIEPDGTIAHGTTVFSRPEAEEPSDSQTETWSETGSDDAGLRTDLERELDSQLGESPRGRRGRSI
jgi:hypothetical protein